MKMRNENNTNNIPPEYLKNVERMMKKHGLNKDGSPIFYDALSSHQQNDNNTNNSESHYESVRRSQSINNNKNSFMVVGQKGKRKTKNKSNKRVVNALIQKGRVRNHRPSEKFHTPHTSSQPRGAAAEEIENIQHITFFFRVLKFLRLKYKYRCLYFIHFLHISFYSTLMALKSSLYFMMLLNLFSKDVIRLLNPVSFYL